MAMDKAMPPQGADEPGKDEERPLDATNTPPPLDADVERWYLRLYVAGQTPKSLVALMNLKRYCEENLQGRYEIEVIDLVEHPELAESDQIVALPTLVRRLPPPMKKIIGDLSNKEKILVGLDIKPVR